MSRMNTDKKRKIRNITETLTDDFKKTYPFSTFSSWSWWSGISNQPLATRSTRLAGCSRRSRRSPIARSTCESRQTILSIRALHRARTAEFPYNVLCASVKSSIFYQTYVIISNTINYGNTSHETVNNSTLQPSIHYNRVGYNEVFL